MESIQKTAAGKLEYQGQTYYFCSPGCKKSFDKDPRSTSTLHEHSGHH
jgi:Cu+-exporting ATPase